MRIIVGWRGRVLQQRAYLDSRRYTGAATRGEPVELRAAMRFAAIALACTMFLAASGAAGAGSARGASGFDPWPCYPDVNGDGVVSITDIGFVVSYFGQTVPPAPPTADLNGDAVVAITDIGVLVQSFGRICVD
ncbi:MAG: dockerin type I domain-containing protein [Dehalococcoidia bacterium]